MGITQMIRDSPQTSPQIGGKERRARRRLYKVGLFIFSLYLFMLAITLMKESAHSLTPLLRDTFHATTPVRALGFGWLAAYILMSGSPVAAAALAFLDAGAIEPLAAFTMITGSRLGASFIVLFLGFIYVLRGRNRATSLSMGLLTFGITTTTYLAGLVLGIGILQSGALPAVQIGAAPALQSVFERLFLPIAALGATLLPAWGVFLVGLAVIITSFSLFDRCLPQMTIRESQVGHVSRLVYSPWIMFTLGGAVTLISMSVSVSLGILVPLSQRGFIRRENVIPYVMGANITTFVDTLLASLLLTDPAGFNVVLASMISTTVVSVSILALFYRRYERAMLAYVAWINASSRRFAIFALLIFVVPMVLLLI